MLSFLPAPLLFVINFTLISVVTAILAIPVFVLAFVRLILPFGPVLSFVDRINQAVFYLWISNNAFLMWLTNRIKWDIQGADIEKIKGSCFIISNHVTWTDIVMLGQIYRGKIPITKFFLIRRYSRNELLKNPKLKTKDIDATRKACQNLLQHPSTLVNFVEGTRFTPEKAKAQQSQYRHLMPPKAASLAIALGLIGPHIDCLLNTTLVYPGEHKGSIFMEMLCGRLKHVIARVEVMDKETINAHMVGDYLQDKQFKHTFTMYLRQLWQRKDDLIESLLQQNGYAASTPDANTSADTNDTESSTAAPAVDASTTADVPATEAEAKATKKKSTQQEENEPITARNRITASISAD